MKINFLDNKNKNSKKKDNIFNIKYSSVKKADKDIKTRQAEVLEKKKSKNFLSGLFSTFKKEENSIINKDVHKSRKKILEAIKKERKMSKKRKGFMRFFEIDKKKAPHKLIMKRDPDKAVINSPTPKDNNKEAESRQNDDKKMADEKKEKDSSDVKTVSSADRVMEGKKEEDCENKQVKLLKNKKSKGFLSGLFSAFKKQDNSIINKVIDSSKGEDDKKKAPHKLIMKRDPDKAVINSPTPKDNNKEAESRQNDDKKMADEKKEKDSSDVKTVSSADRVMEGKKEEDLMFLLKEEKDKNEHGAERINMDYVKAFDKKDKGNKEKKEGNLYRIPKKEDEEKSNNKKEKNNYFLALLLKITNMIKGSTENKDGQIKKNLKKENGWKSSELIETNLIKDKIIVFYDWKSSIIIFSISMIITVSSLIGVYYGLSVWEEEKAKDIKEIDDTIALLDKKIKLAEKDANKVIIFKNKLILAGKLLDQHVYWTNFFNFLEKYTLKNVQYSGFSGGYGEKYVLNAFADTYSSIESQVKSMMENEYVKNLRVEAGESSATKGLNMEGINFNLSIEIDPKMFLE